MFKRSFSLATATATAFAAAAFLPTHNARADVVEYDFTVELLVVTDGPPPIVGDTFTGSFTFDDDFGAELFAGVETFDLLSFDFELLGESFGLGAISSVPSVPPVVDFDIATGEILGLFVDAGSFLPGLTFDIVPNDFGPPEFAFVFEEAGGASGSGTVGYTLIPEPTTAALIGLGLAGVAGRRVRRDA